MTVKRFQAAFFIAIVGVLIYARESLLAFLLGLPNFFLVTLPYYITVEFPRQFVQSFITDDRYLYLLTGLRNTLVIAFFACILGVTLGFLVAYIRTSHDKTGNFKIGNALCKLYLTVIRGTPSMVQLMLIYYVILVSMDNKILVAVIAFGINSGAYVAETFRAGIMSIDPGQMEAARSLGLSYTQATWKIILPQTFKNVLPALGNELIVLLKETSISGYIGIAELTRGANIIISRTYSSALPLVAIALIYLAVVMVLQELVNRMEARLAQSDR